MAENTDTDLRSLILSVDSEPKQTITVDGWLDQYGNPVTVMLRGLRTHEVLEMADTDDSAAVLAKTVTACVLDPATGKQVFQPDDAAKLFNRPFAPIMAVVKKINELSGLKDDSIPKMQEVFFEKAGRKVIRPKTRVH